MILSPIRLLSEVASFAAAAAFAVFLIVFGRTVTVAQILKLADVDHEQGFAYHCLMTTPKWHEAVSDDLSDGVASGLRLFEDGRELGPAHSLHADIRKKGMGRFSHWKGYLYFSASDNSDPTTNGRSYSVRYPATSMGSLGADAAKWFGIAAAVLALPFLAGGVVRKEEPAGETEKVDRPQTGFSSVLGATFKTLAWALVYVAALILIVTAIRAEQQHSGGFKINFEYKVF